MAGAIDLASGQAALALTELERALALSQGHRFYAGCLAQLRYLLARALVETHGRQDALRRSLRRKRTSSSPLFRRKRDSMGNS